MSTVDPPAIRWISEGEHAGFYIFAPALAGKWRKVDPVNGLPDIVREVPPGSEGLYCYADVSALLDQYRDTLQQGGNHRETWLTDADVHDCVKAAVLADLVDAEEYAVVRAGELFARYREETSVPTGHDSL